MLLLVMLQNKKKNAVESLHIQIKGPRWLFRQFIISLTALVLYSGQLTSHNLTCQEMDI